MIYLGIDIGGTTVKYGIITAAGEVLYKKEYPVAFDAYQTPILDTVMKTSRIFIDEYLNLNQARADQPIQLGGIGVSATGQIDSAAGVVAGAGGNIANWVGSRIKASLETAYQVPVSVLNDADCAILAELWLGNARNAKHAVMITIGTGVGGGIIVNGDILLGARGFAGELGHFIIKKDGRKCTCGNRGCYEQYASMTALIRQVREKLPLAGYPDLVPALINGRTIFELVAQGEAVVTSVVNSWIHDIADGLVSFIHLFNPEVVLIGGGISAQQNLLIEPLQQLIRAGTMENFASNLRIVPAALLNDAGMIGAVYYLRTQQQ